MKVYRYYTLTSAPFRPSYISAKSVWEALEYLRYYKATHDVTSIEELGPVEIVPAKETP